MFTRRASMPRLLALLLATASAGPGLAQPAPIARAVVPATEAPEAMSGFYDGLSAGEETIAIDGAQWLQLHFGEFDLGDGSLTITAEDGDSQTFDQAQLEAWGGLTAIFNGSSLTVSLSEGATAEIEEIVIGLPAPAGQGGSEAATPQPLFELLGDDLDRFIPEEDIPALPDDGTSIEGAMPGMAPGQAVAESICGTADNRSASNHPFSGRIMPIGCTGWIIQGGAILTAGHCIGSGTQTLEFNVPSSLSNGTTVSPPVQHQYRVVSSSIVSSYTGVGNDWAVFQVLPNTQTGLTAIAAQGGGFQPSNAANPSSVVVAGYGVDGPAPSFGNPPPRNADNQTQQIHSGNLTENSVQGPSQATIRYAVDTQGGNSGSPVFGPGNVAIGIHTNGGCGASGGANSGTSFRNAALWNAVGAIAPPPPGTSVAISGWVKLLLPGN